LARTGPFAIDATKPDNLQKFKDMYFGAKFGVHISKVGENLEHQIINSTTQIGHFLLKAMFANHITN